MKTKSRTDAKQNWGGLARLRQIDTLETCAEMTMVDKSACHQVGKSTGLRGGSDVAMEHVRNDSSDVAPEVCNPDLQFAEEVLLWNDSQAFNLRFDSETRCLNVDVSDRVASFLKFKTYCLPDCDPFIYDIFTAKCRYWMKAFSSL